MCPTVTQSVVYIVTFLVCLVSCLRSLNCNKYVKNTKQGYSATCGPLFYTDTVHHLESLKLIINLRECVLKYYSFYVIVIHHIW